MTKRVFWYGLLGMLAVCGAIGFSLAVAIVVGAACPVEDPEYFIVGDNFEWGENFDPLTDSGGSVDWSIVAGSGSSAAISTTAPYAGTRCGVLYKFSTVSPVAWFSQEAVSNDAVIEMRVKKSDGSDFLLYHGDASARIAVRFETDEEVRYRDNGSWVNTGETVSVDTWHFLEVKDVDWVQQTYDIYLDSVLIADDAEMWLIGCDDKIYLSNIGGSVSMVYFDNVYAWWWVGLELPVWMVGVWLTLVGLSVYTKSLVASIVAIFVGVGLATWLALGASGTLTIVYLVYAGIACVTGMLILNIFRRVQNV